MRGPSWHDETKPGPCLPQNHRLRQELALAEAPETPCVKPGLGPAADDRLGQQLADDGRHHEAVPHEPRRLEEPLHLVDGADDGGHGAECIPWAVVGLLLLAMVIVWPAKLATRRVDGTPVWQWLVLLILLGATEWVLLSGVLDR